MEHRRGIAILIQVTVLAALGLALLLAGCASRPVHGSEQVDARSWDWCDRVQQGHPTLVCFQH